MRSKFLREIVSSVMSLQAGQPNIEVKAMVVTERVNASLSLFGIASIMWTYLFEPSFNTPINRTDLLRKPGKHRIQHCRSHI